MTITLSELATLAVGLLTLVLANAIAHRVPFLERLSVPIPVLGGVLVAVVMALIYRQTGTTIQFASGLRDFFLLVFFTTIGLSAKFSALKAGGKPLVILCVVTVLLLVTQNFVGLLVAWAVGANPFYGLLIGSVSFVGGPGTAAAWATEAQAVGLERAPEIAVGAATLAVVFGAIVSGPITGWLIRRNHSRGALSEPTSTWVAPVVTNAAPMAASVPKVLQVLLVIVAAVVAGDAVNTWARGIGMVLPGFLTAMLAGVAITNLADLFGRDMDFQPIERGGEIALQCFLVMYLMSLKLWTLESAIGPLMINLVIQIAVTAAIGILVLYRWLGRDYDAAVTVGGFLGFGLSSMPVAMATMDSVTSRFGPSPKALLLIALAGSFFVDLANAFIVKAFLASPLVH